MGNNKQKVTETFIIYTILPEKFYRPFKSPNPSQLFSLNMINTRCIFIGGKQLGLDCLDQIFEFDIRPQLALGNSDDNGEDKLLHQSFIKCAEKKNLRVIRNQSLRSLKLIESFKKAQPEIIFSIGGTRLIPPEILKIPRLGCLNIHPALLPKYRGRYSTAHAIFNGETRTGVTLHWIDGGIDTGPIVFQEPITISPDDTAKSLYEKLTVTGGKLFTRFLKLWLSGEPIPSMAQDNSLSTYYPKVLPNDGKIDWSWSGEQIRNFIRAMTFEPFPPIQMKFGEKDIVIIDENLSTNHRGKLPNKEKIDWSWSGEQIRNFIQAITIKPFYLIKFNIGKKNMVIVEKKFYKY